MGEPDVDKLIEAVTVVVRRQLRDSSDDTLAEKLVSLVEELVQQPCRQEDISCRLIGRLVECYQQDPDGCDLGLLARLCGALLQNETTFGSDNVDRARCLLAESVQRLDCLPNYTDQTGLLACLLKISAHQSGNGWIMDQHLSNFLQQLLTLCRSSSYFVRCRAEQLMVRLITLNHHTDGMRHFLSEELAAHYVDSVHLSILDTLHDQLPHLDVFKQIQQRMPADFERISLASHADSHLRNQFLRLYGQLMPEELVLEQLEPLASSVRCWKPVIVLLCQLLITKRHSKSKDRLLELAALALADESERSEQQLGSFRAAVADRNSPLIMLTSLSPEVLAQLDNDSHYDLATRIAKFVRARLLRGTPAHKLINEALSCLGRIARSSHRHTRQKILHETADFTGLASGSHIFLINQIKLYRCILEAELCEPYEPNSNELLAPADRLALSLIREKTTVRRYQPETDIELAETWELLDSVMELLSVMIRVDHGYLRSHPETFNQLMRLIGNRIDESNFINSLVVLIIPLNKYCGETIEQHLTLDRFFEKELGTHNPDFSLRLLTLLMTDLDWFCRACLGSEQQLRTALDKLAHLVHYTIDNRELQSAALQMLKLIVEAKRAEDEELLLATLLQSRTVEAICALLLSTSEDSPRIIEAALELKNVIVALLKARGIGCKEQLLPLLNQAKESQRKLTATDDCTIEQGPNGIEERKEIIEHIFRGHLNQPTLDIIDELSKRRHLAATTALPTLAFEPDQLIQVLFSNCSQELDHRAQHLGQYSILQDILAAKETENKAFKDCY